MSSKRILIIGGNCNAGLSVAFQIVAERQIMISGYLIHQTALLSTGLWTVVGTVLISTKPCVIDGCFKNKMDKRCRGFYWSQENAVLRKEVETYCMMYWWFVRNSNWLAKIGGLKKESLGKTRSAAVIIHWFCPIHGKWSKFQRRSGHVIPIPLRPSMWRRSA